MCFKFVFPFEQRYNNVGGFTNFHAFFLLGWAVFLIFVYNISIVTDNNKNTFTI